MRRVAFHGATPADKFRLNKAYLTRITSTKNTPLVGAALETHVADSSKWGEVDQKPISDPSDSWTFGVVTGESYMMKF